MSDGVNVHKTSNDQGKEGVVTAYEVIRKDLPRKITPDRKHDMRVSHPGKTVQTERRANVSITGGYTAWKWTLWAGAEGRRQGQLRPKFWISLSDRRPSMFGEENGCNLKHV